MTLGCDFEKNLCKWHQEYDDDFDWTLRDDTPAGAGIGPMNDHTGLNQLVMVSRESYLFFLLFFK